MISKGFLTDARTLAEGGSRRSSMPFAAAGVPILGLEPSLHSHARGRVAGTGPRPGREAGRRGRGDGRSLARATGARQWAVTAHVAAGEGPLLHAHCHQKALVGGEGQRRGVCGWFRGADVTVLDAGCCGMAGAFGYEKEHYDVSVKIANLALVPAVNANPTATVVATGTSCRHQIRDDAVEHYHQRQALAEMSLTNPVR